MLANIDSAPLSFNVLLLENPFCSQDKLLNIIKKHYTRQAITELHTLLGSTEILGNPVGLFHSVGSGVVDFFYEPAQGLVTSPKAFGTGLAKVSS